MENIDDKLKQARRQIKILNLDIEANQNLALTGLSQSIIQKDKAMIHDLKWKMISLKDQQEKEEKEGK